MRMTGDKMLGGVDLHPGKAHRPVDLAAHLLARNERRIAEMDDPVPLLAGVRHSDAAERAGVAALPAALREKHGPVERYGIAPAALFARENEGGKLPPVGIGIVELLGHGFQNLKRFSPVTASLKRSTVPSITVTIISHVALTRAALRCPPTTVPDSFAALICRWL